MNEPRTRQRLDFYSNPVFSELLAELDEMVRKETASLKSTARGVDHAKANVQVGIVDGIERVVLRLKNSRDEVLRSEGQELSTP